MSVRRIIYFFSPADGFIIARLTREGGKNSVRTDFRLVSDDVHDSIFVIWKTAHSERERERGTPTVINLARSLEF